MTNKAILISGPKKSGKRTLFEALKRSFDAECLFIEIEENMDSKQLLGTYRVNEEDGEFEFSKGPLSFAAEKGMWVVLSGLEKGAGEMLNVLHPLIQH